MTPNEPRRRTGIDRMMGQFADLSVKLEQLLEGNGNIIDEVSKIPGIKRKISVIEREALKIPGVERTVSITAKGLIDLTTNVNQRFDQLQQVVSFVKAGQQVILQILRE